MSIETISIKNEYLTVKISTLGAEIKSIVSSSDDRERIHQSDMFWHDSSPILFPVCGNVCDGYIRVDGKKFKMSEHGFAKNEIFNVMEFTEDFAVFSLKSNEETKKIYPYDFELLVTFKLLGKSIDVCYEIINDSDKPMYFSIGAHEGYNLNGRLEDYYLKFEPAETAVPLLDGIEEMKIEGGKLDTLDTSNELFDTSRAIIFKSPSSKKVTLINKNGNDKITVEFEDISYLVFWSVPNTQFVCIEPWCGIGEFKTVPEDISKKNAIECLDKGEQFEHHHIITVD